MTSKNAVVERDSVSKLPDEWRIAKFGDVVQNVKVDVKPEESGLERYVAGEHMDTDDLHIRRWGTIGDGYLGPAFHRKFVKGQVLYGSRRTYLRKVAVAEFDGICANTTLVLEPKGDELISELLPFIMQTESFTEHSVKQSRGSVNPYINWSDLAWYEFALPPKDEQRRIADILWTADENICLFENIIFLTLSYRSVLFEHLINNNSSTKPDFFKRSWQKVKFSSLMTDSPQSGYSAVSASRETGHFVLSLSALTKNGYQSGHLKPVELTPEVEATKLKKGDFIISRSNTFELVGLAGIFNEEREDISFPDTMMLIRVDENQINKRFLEQFLLSKQGRLQIQKIAAGTSASMKKINRQGLSSLLIPLPPLEIQESIIEQLDVVTKAVQATETKLESCRKLKNALLKEFFLVSFKHK